MKQITAAETPLQLVEKYRRKYSFKDTYDAMDEAKDKLVEAFPECFCDWCQMPIAVPTNLLATAGYTPIECVRDGASLSACYLWRQYKIIYDFAGPLAEELAQQAFDVSALDTLPVQFLIENMPYPCLYLRTHTISPNAAGAFVWIERDVNTLQAELRIGIVSNDMDSIFNICLNLVNGGTLEDCLRATIEYTENNLDKASELEKKIIEKETFDEMSSLKLLPTLAIVVVLQLLLYIESANAEVEDNREQKAVYRQPRKKSDIKDRFREVRQVEVGVRVSRALLSAKRSGNLSGGGHGAGKGSSKSSHMRRGHWHHYWTGPHDGERKLILKWVAPTVIHPDDLDAEIPNVIPINKGKNQ